MPTTSRGPTARSTPRLQAGARAILELLRACGGSLEARDLAVLLFLYGRTQPDGEAPYDFTAGKEGPVSFTAEADLEKLVARGLVRRDGGLHLTKEGRALLGRSHDATIQDFVEHHQDLRGDALLAEAFARDPFVALRATDAERLLEGAALSRVKRARKEKDAPALSTIGYEGLSLERYLNVLLSHGVTLLCDVRANPNSRKFGFAKRALSHGCETVGIRYEHLPELGIATEKRKGVHTREDYDALFLKYERDWLPKQSAALDRIRSWIAEGERVALTCYEHDPNECHRRSVAKALAETGLEAVHL